MEDRYRRLMELLDKVRLNDPETAEVDFSNDDLYGALTNRKAQRLGAAMVGNTHVTMIHLNLRCLTAKGKYQTLLAAIQNCSQLEVVVLWSNQDEEEDEWQNAGADERQNAADTNHRFLAAIAGSLVVDVGLAAMAIGADSLALLSRAGNMAVLSFEDCDLVPRNGVDADEAAAAIGENLALRTVCFHSCGGGMLVTRIVMAGLESHPTLEKLLCCGIQGDEQVIVSALCGVLESHGNSSVLQHLHLECFQFNAASPLDPMATAFQANTSLTKLTLDDCQFDRASGEDLLAMLQSNTTVRTLTLGGGSFSVDYQGGDKAFFTELLRGETGLQELNVEEEYPDRQAPRLYQLLDAMEGNTTLERLVLGRLADFESFHRVIPTLRWLKELTITLPRRGGVAAFDKAAMLLTLERNSSLIKVTIVDEDGLLTEEDMALVRSYEARNQDTLRLGTLYDSLSPSEPHWTHLGGLV